MTSETSFYTKQFTHLTQCQSPPVTPLYSYSPSVNKVAQTNEKMRRSLHPDAFLTVTTSVQKQRSKARHFQGQEGEEQKVA